MRRASLVLFLCCALAPLASGTPASADDAPPPVAVRLDYQLGAGASQCPGEERLRQVVEQRMGYDPFKPGATQTVSVAIQRQVDAKKQPPDQLVGRIVYLDAGGKPVDASEFVVPDTICGCWALITDLAVSIAFMITPFQVPEPPPPPPLEPPACPEVTPVPRPRAPGGPERPLPPRRARFALQVGAGGMIGVGLAEQPTLGAFGLVRARWPALSVALEGRAHLPAATSGDLGTPVEIGLLSGAVLPCFHWGIVFGCTVGEVGSLRLRGASVDAASDLLVGLGWRGGVEVPLGARLLLQARAEAIGTVTPSRLPIRPLGEDGRDVWRTPALVGTLGAALSASF